MNEINARQKKRGLDKIRILSGAQLKYIAFLSMLIDHTNKAIIYPNLDGGGILLEISDLFDILGRVAFPLFAFFLVEGFFKTRSRKKYLIYLVGFGIISEVPFDMFSSAEFFNMDCCNIFFTLAMMLIMIWMIDILKTKVNFSGHNILGRLVWYLISFVIVAAACLITMNAGMDYEHHAILIAYFMYIFRQKPIGYVIFGYLSMVKEVWSLLGFGLTLTYNGKRGKQYKILNYCFYPAHLLVLGILRMYLGI